jgi:hypothetical protein
MFPFSGDMFMPGETFVQMNSKMFSTFCLRERFIVDPTDEVGFRRDGREQYCELHNTNVWMDDKLHVTLDLRHNLEFSFNGFMDRHLV